MGDNGKKEPWEILKDKMRSVFSPLNPQEKKNALPPKTHFSIWYFLMAIILFSYLQQYFLLGKVETIPCSQFDMAGNCIKIKSMGGKNGGYHERQ